MSEHFEVRIPDIGTDEKVDVVEILVAVGETVAKDDGLVTLESDKASMDVPSPVAGVIREIRVKVGDQVEQGDLILSMESQEALPPAADPPAPAPTTPTVPVSPTPPTPPNTPEPPLATVPPSKKTAASPASSAGSEQSSSSHAPPPVPDGVTTQSDVHAEVLVLGAGPGGYTAAFRAADLGKKVVLVERYAALGGVCLNVGCIPSKALLHIAKVISEAAAIEEHGVYFGKPKIGLDQLRAWKTGVVERLTKGLTTMAKQRKVEVVVGTGRFTGARELEVTTPEGTRAISFDTAIIAAGSRVTEIPGIPYNDPRVMDSTGALELADIPKRLLVVGGGIIGLEMAMVYGALGTKLTIVELLDGLIPGCDRDLVRPLERRLKRELGAEIFLETKVLGVEAGKSHLKANFEGAKAPPSAHFDRVLVSVGRRPNGDRLNAEAAGVQVDPRGFIAVDEQMRTNAAHIFAIGDIVGPPMLAHKASHEGRVAAEVAAGEKSAFDAKVIPSVAYTDPEIAWVGLTETDAKATGAPYEKGSFPWAASGRALGMGRTEGLTKILFDPRTNRVLGAGIVGPGAGDLISELALAIEMDCEAGDIGLTVHPHPTLSETVAFAAEAYEGTITDLYLPKK